ncbi:MAG TPA: hypothetical protein VIJ55_02495 [Acetobacteraceae bacterium]
MIVFPTLLVISATAALGLVLVLLHGLRRPRLLRFAGPLHGGLGFCGLVLLLVALRGPARGVAYGAGGFGTMAAVLLGCAILAGLLVLRMRLRSRDPMMAIGLHATLAIFGLILLAAYATMPA